MLCGYAVWSSGLLQSVDQPNQLLCRMRERNIVVLALSPLLSKVRGKDRIPKADIFGGVVKCVAQILQNSWCGTRGTAYGVSFESVCQEVMGPVQARQLRRLIGFTFHRHPKLNLPEYRLQAIEKHIQVRVQQLLRLQPEHEKEPVKHGGPER